MRCPAGGDQHTQGLHKDHHPKAQLRQGKQLSISSVTPSLLLVVPFRANTRLNNVMSEGWVFHILSYQTCIQQARQMPVGRQAHRKDDALEHQRLCRLRPAEPDQGSKGRMRLQLQGFSV